MKKDKHFIKAEAMSFSLRSGFTVYPIPTFTDKVYRLGYVKEGVRKEGRKTYTPEEAEAKIHEMYLEFYYQEKPEKRPIQCKNLNNGVCLYKNLCKCFK